MILCWNKILIGSQNLIRLFANFAKKHCMTDIPLHKAVQQSDFGIFAKEVSPFSPNRLINYTHRDSYYIFGIVESGTCRIGIDFKDCDLSAGSVI